MNLLNDRLRYFTVFFQEIFHQFLFEIVNRPVIRETVFMPDRKPPQLVSTRDAYAVSNYSYIN